MLTLVEYQRRALEANRFERKGELLPPLLGVFGETGSLLTGAKKCLREKNSDTGTQEVVIEELGDVLWYLTVMLDTAGLSISDVLQGHPDSSSVAKPHVGTFLEMDAWCKDNAHLSRECSRDVDFTLIVLAASVGKLTTRFYDGVVQGDVDIPLDDFQRVFVALSQLAFSSNISMQDVAQRNLEKIFDRWPETRSFQESFDSRFEEDERLPGHIVIDIFEKKVAGKVYVFQKCRDLFLGNRLTDNVIVKDDYRFHDVFHFANAAVLSWSPVLRGLLKRKRKSVPEIDETEDGARAAIIEEGVVAWIFAQASNANYFAGIDRGELSFGLLKQIRKLTSNYEVAKCPLWQWEEAILQGYEAFRYLQEHRKARITVDTIRHRLECEAMP